MLRTNISTPLYVQLYREILHDISAGRLSKGAPLPGERQMAMLHGISRVTVQKAYDMLEDEGYIVTVRGKGTYILEARH